METSAEVSKSDGLAQEDLRYFVCYVVIAVFFGWCAGLGVGQLMFITRDETGNLWMWVINTLVFLTGAVLFSALAIKWGFRQRRELHRFRVASGIEGNLGQSSTR